MSAEKSAEAPRTPSEADLQELEMALRAATPGPWEADAYSVHAPGQFDMFGKMEEVVLRDEGSSADLELVAALRNAAPSLIGEVRRLRAALAARDAEWREALTHKHQGGQWWQCGNCDEFLFPEDDGKPPFWKEDGDDHKRGDLWDGCPACAPLRALLSEGKPGQ